MYNNDMYELYARLANDYLDKLIFINGYEEAGRILLEDGFSSEEIQMLGFRLSED